MTAHNPLAALLGALPITVNITINGGIHLGNFYEGATTVERYETTVEHYDEAAYEELESEPDEPTWDVTVIRPSVGRIVHYRPTHAEHLQHGTDFQCFWAALIVGVFEGSDGSDLCSLLAFPPGRRPVVIANCVHQGDTDTLGTWFWPEQV